MPVAVVALAAGSFAAGATAFAAATTLAASVAAGAVMVGSALTIVGTVTGNQKLTKIGAIVSLVGGVGSLAANAMSVGAEASAVGAGAEAASGATEAAGAAGAAGDAASAAGAVQTFPVAAPGGIESLDAAGSASGGGMLSAAGDVANSADALAGQSVMAGKTAAQMVPGAASTAADATPFAAPTADTFDAAATTVGKSATTDGFSKAGALNPYSTQGAGGMLGAVESGAGGSLDPSTFSQFQQWVKQNPEMAKMAAGAVQGEANMVPTARDRQMMEYYRQQSATQKAMTDAQIATLNRRALWGSGRTA